MKSTSILLLIISVIVNILFFQRLQNRNSLAIETLFVGAQEDYGNKLIQISKYAGDKLSDEIQLTDSHDTINFSSLLTQHENTVFFLTGKDACSSCLELELSRIRKLNSLGMIIIGDYSLEKKIRFLHKKYGYHGPTYFTNLEDFGLADPFLIEPTYILISKDARINYIQSTSYDDDYGMIQLIVENLMEAAS